MYHCATCIPVDCYFSEIKIEPTIYHTQSETAKAYTNNAVKLTSRCKLYFTHYILPERVGSSWSWLHGSWIYNYLYNQCLSALMLWVWTPIRWDVLDTALCWFGVFWLQQDGPQSFTKVVTKKILSTILFFLLTVTTTVAVSSTTTSGKMNFHFNVYLVCDFHGINYNQVRCTRYSNMLIWCLLTPTGQIFRPLKLEQTCLLCTSAHL
jgi:hypothetical protein